MPPRTVDELIRYRRTTHPSHPTVLFSSPGKKTIYTTTDIDNHATRAARLYTQRYNLQPRSSSAQPQTVVGVIGTTTPEYLITILAVAKLGHAALLLSPRLASDVYGYLLQEAGASLLLIQDGFEQLQAQVQHVSLSVGRMAQHHEYASISEETTEGTSTEMTPALDTNHEQETPVWVLHSSGSTGLPKLVPVTNRSALARYADAADLLGHDTLTTLPMFHAYGMTSVFRMLWCGGTVQIWDPHTPITTGGLVGVARKRRFGLFATVPAVLKMLAEEAEGVRFLRGFEVVTSGGSPLAEGLGEELVREGVRVVGIYGMSETGTLLSSIRPVGDPLWNWLRRPEGYGYLLRFEDRGAEFVEPVCPKEWPAIVASNQPDGSWKTNDLFIKHPHIEAYKYVGRLDDILVLENGEKANPVDVEMEISKSALVEACIVFGANRPCLGIAIIPSQAVSKDRLLDAIWPVVQNAQSQLPAYARLSPEMTLLLDAGTPYPKTDKGTVVRKQFAEQFRDEIDMLYMDSTAGQEQLAMSGPEIREFLDLEVRRILDVDDTVENDFMALGMDSLQAAQLRKAIMARVDLNGRTLGLNVVFDFPTVSLLADEIDRVVSGRPELDLLGADQRVADAILEKYSDFHQPGLESHGEEHVVLTGATGSLGAHLLAQLVSLPKVTRVYCLVRATTDDIAHSRLTQSLQSRRLLPRDLSKVTCLASDLSSPQLGLNSQALSEIARTVTSIYHSAWTVNFNQRLESFEPELASVFHLLSLCIKSNRKPARFLFFSSISATARIQTDPVSELPSAALQDAQPTGYARAKQVAETICVRAGKSANISIGILRIGQIIGDTARGIWNPSEAVPLMLRSAHSIGALPALDQIVKWLPVDVVARISIEIASSDILQNPGASVFNIVNPHGLHWTTDLLPMFRQAGLIFDTVEPAKWLARLRASNTDVVANPTMKLLEYFARLCEDGRSHAWTCGNARVSSTFETVQAPSLALIAANVHYLQSTWK